MPDKTSQHQADFQNLLKLESPGKPSDGSSFTSFKQMHKAFGLVTQWFGLQKNGDFHQFINTSQQIRQLINQLFSKSVFTSSISLLRIPAWMPSPLGGRGGGTSSGTPPYVDNGKNWNKILIPSAIRLDGTNFIDQSSPIQKFSPIHTWSTNSCSLLQLPRTCCSFICCSLQCRQSVQKPLQLAREELPRKVHTNAQKHTAPDVTTSFYHQQLKLCKAATAIIGLPLWADRNASSVQQGLPNQNRSAHFKVTFLIFSLGIHDNPSTGGSARQKLSSSRLTSNL